MFCATFALSDGASGSPTVSETTCPPVVSRNDSVSGEFRSNALSRSSQWMGIFFIKRNRSLRSSDAQAVTLVTRAISLGIAMLYDDDRTVCPGLSRLRLGVRRARQRDPPRGDGDRPHSRPPPVRHRLRRRDGTKRR